MERRLNSLGIVHIAPAFGEDDARVGRDNHLPFVQLVDTQGKFVEGTPWLGEGTKQVNEKIIEDLRGRGLLLAALPFTHSYPFCWRCDTPLLYYARERWFIRMTAVRDELVNNKRTVNWMPDTIKEGRMGNFLENVVDWGRRANGIGALRCRFGSARRVIFTLSAPARSCARLPPRPGKHRAASPLPGPGRNQVRRVRRPMHRVKAVIDCWYDCGSMPFAQWHYPFENKEHF